MRVFADQRSDAVDRVDMCPARHHAAICLALPLGHFHGNSSGSRDTEIAGMQSSTSVNQTCGSMSFTFAAIMEHIKAARSPPRWEPANSCTVDSRKGGATSPNAAASGEIESGMTPLKPNHS